MTLLLTAANHALNDKKDAINPRWYPQYHLAPQAGWMNDPNGLTWFDGYFHAFFQHYPFGPDWGPMHWGHARSRDMVRWEHLPVALAPEGPEDKDGCFSGSAVVNGDTLALIYTGHKFHGEPVEANLYQVQCLATSTDGMTFQRQGQVIDTPAGVHHFRDPKVWREGEAWYMVVGARTADIGEVQIYRSADLRHWEFESNIKQDDGTLGFMWECPDLFTLGETQVLMFSPQGVRADGYHNRNLFQSGYLTGKWQPGSPFVATSEFKELDHGHDFYAPQSFTTPDGRRVVIGWLAMWESPMPEKADGWAGMLSLPRELMLDDRGNVRMTPVKELETLRGKQYPWPVSELHNQTLQVADHASAMEISLCWDMSHSDAEQYGLSLGDGARLYVDNQSRRLVLSRDYPQAGLSGYRSVPLPEDGLLHLRIFIDHSSLEVFVNQGAFTLSSRIYPDPLRRTLSLFSQQGHAVVQQACAWELVN